MNEYEKFEQEVLDAQAAFEAAEDDLKAADARYDAHIRFDRWAHHERINQILPDIFGLEDQAKNHAASAAGSKKEVARLDRNIRTLWNPKNWRNSEQRTLRARRRLASGAYKRSVEAEQAALLQAEPLTAEVRALEQEIEAHCAVEVEDLARDRARKREARANREAEFDALHAKLEAFQRKHILVFHDLQRTEQELERLETQKQIADELERQLQTPPHNKTRSEIHEEAQRRLGDSRPRRVISSLSGRIARTERDLDKLYERLDLETRKAQRTIKRVVVDGSNLCYFNDPDSRFIGLPVLQALLPQLERHYEVQVIFDGNIGRKLGVMKSDVPRMLPTPQNVHVGPGNQKADPIYLRYVQGQPTSYILTNDRLRNFPDQEAAVNRTLRFNLFHDRLIIDDLDLNITLPTSLRELAEDKNAQAKNARGKKA